jgi:hypothetical protein
MTEGARFATETVGGLMRRIAEDSGEVRLVFDENLDRCYNRSPVTGEPCTCER